MKKKMAMLLSGAMLIAALTGCSGNSDTSDPGSSTDQGSESQPAEALIVKYGTPEQENMAGGQTSLYFTDLINETGEGIIQLETYTQGTLGNDAETLAQVIDGTLPMGQCGPAAFSQYTDLLDCVQLPFLITDYEIEQEAFKSEEYQALLGEVEELLDIKFLGTGENGIRHFATVNKPITCVADLKGMMIRVAPSNMLTDAMTLLGANPQSISYSELYSALQNKVVDGEEVNISSLASQKHYEVVNYCSEIGMYPYPSMYFVNGTFWRSLTEEQQQILQDGVSAGTDRLFNELIESLDASFKEECIENDVVFNVIEDKSEFEEIVSPLYETYTKQAASQAFVDRVLAIKEAQGK